MQEHACALFLMLFVLYLSHENFKVYDNQIKERGGVSPSVQLRKERKIKKKKVSICPLGRPCVTESELNINQEF